MEHQRPEDDSTQIKKKKSSNSTTTPIRIKKGTHKKLKTVLVKANKKSFGRKIKVDDLLELLVSLIEDKHISKLQENSLSNADRLEMKYREFCKQSGHVSKDEFIGKLINSNALPESSQ